MVANSKPGAAPRVPGGTLECTPGVHTQRMSDKKRKIPQGLVTVCVALATGAVCYMLGRMQTVPEGTPAYARSTVGVREVGPWDDLENDELDGEAEAPGAPAAEKGTPAGSIKPISGVTTDELVGAVTEKASSPQAQQILAGYIAQAALRGEAMLPEIAKLLREGSDAKLAVAKDGKGHPTLRVALMEAALATGAAEAIELIAELAQNTESTVEIVFSAHMLDRIDALDQETARRTIDALGTQISKDEMKMMGSVIRQVIPAAAGADPVYAENFLVTQLHTQEGAPRVNPRLVAPLLDGLPADRTTQLVLETLSAADVSERSKRMLVSRAAARPETPILIELRRAMDNGTMTPRVAATVARSSVNARPFRTIEKAMRRAIVSGDFAKAHALSGEYMIRLTEARKTIASARALGARVSPQADKQAGIHADRLRDRLLELARAKRKAEKKAAQAAKNQ